MDIDIEDLLNRIIILECELEFMSKNYKQVKAMAEMCKELAIQSGALYRTQQQIVEDLNQIKQKMKDSDSGKIKEMMEKFKQTQMTVAGIVDIINKMETRRWN